ncbi:Protein SAR DEFICIENT 4 [Vigna angularis]|uniref:Protein SAR DEFICIENT 4 n=1 Tax=Phaseolus angularis TaxID=3914 RepID=A0A8T0KUX4_PHAAN|nr:Protein SAR DEFICIENT 4 [Vigna angularis]
MQYRHPPYSDKPLLIRIPSSLNHSPNHNSPTLPSLLFFFPSPHALLVLFPVSPLCWRQTLASMGALVPHLIKAHLFAVLSLRKIEGHSELCHEFRETHCEGGEVHHLDLVGSFKPLMMECDDDAIRRGMMFVDNEATIVDARELVGAFERWAIKKMRFEGIGMVLKQYRN